MENKSFLALKLLIISEHFRIYLFKSTGVRSSIGTTYNTHRYGYTRTGSSTSFWSGFFIGSRSHSGGGTYFTVSFWIGIIVLLFLCIGLVAVCYRFSAKRKLNQNG